MSNSYNSRGNTFPNSLAPDSEKKTNEYALKVFKAIYTSFMDGYNSFYNTRNKLFFDNRLFASGQQPIDPLLDMMDIDGKKSYINIDFTPSPIAPKFKNVVVNKSLSQEETVSCVSLNKTVKSRKERKRIEAEFQMENKDLMNEITQESGLDFRNPNIANIDNKDELDLYFNLNDKEREEIIMSRMINFVLENNNWNPYIKKRIISDMWDTNLEVVRTYYDANFKICIENIRPEAFIHSTFFTEDASDATYFGHVKQMTIAEFRVMFPNVPEKEICELANNNSGQYGNSTITYAFLDSYFTSWSRPYDEVKISLLYVWWKTQKTINYIDGVDGYNRKIIDITKGNKGELLNKNKEYKSKVINTAYVGYWALGTDKVFNWEEQRCQTRNPNSLEDIVSPYSVMMPNNDGTMVVRSPQDMIKSSIRGMDECVFKIRQIVANAAPDGYLIDVNGLAGVDLGTGNGDLGPMELVSIRKQTGDTYYNGLDKEGTQRQSPPITPITTSFGSKLQELISLYNFYLGQIRDFLGINEFVEGQAAAPRTGIAVLNTQIGQSNNAIKHIYDSYVYIMDKVSTCVYYMIKDSIVDGNLIDEYKEILGEDDYIWLRKNIDLLKDGYDTEVKIGMMDEEKAEIDNAINLAIQQGSLDIEDKMYIKEINDPKLAIQYLSLKKRKNQKQKQEEAKQASDYNMQAQSAVAEANNKATMQITQMKGEIEMNVAQAKAKSEIESKERSILSDMMIKQGEGVVFPELAQKYLESLLVKYNMMTQDDIDNINKQKQLEQQQEMVEQQQAMQEQQMAEQQQGDPNDYHSQLDQNDEAMMQAQQQEQMQAQQQGQM